MDVAQMLAALVEPPETARVAALVCAARARLEPAQVVAMDHWFNAVPFETAVLDGLRDNAWHPAAMRRYTALIARDHQPLPLADPRLIALPAVLAAAATKPCAASALLWQWLGDEAPDLATHAIHVVRERARLPGLRARVVTGEPRSPQLGATLHVAWFGDRLAADTAAWLAAVPPPPAATLQDAVVAIEAQRTSAPRVAIAELAGFLRQAASMLLAISARSLDPLGFSLGREAELVTSFDTDARVALTHWARLAGHVISARGELVMLRVPLVAPWPFHLEILAAELGRGASGGVGLLLRLHAEHAVAGHGLAPMMLCVPGEPVEERGARFERWLLAAYPHAVAAWRPWV